MRRGTPSDGTNPRGRWQRALYDLALHQLEDLDAHLAQLRDGPLPAPDAPAGLPAPRAGSLLSRVGSAEWNLLTDEADWSGELYQILGRDPAAGPLTLDELPSLVVDEDRPRLTAMVTDCLVDARPIDGEFRILRPGGAVRTVHMMGEPVLDADGSTASMWAVLRDVSELRRSQRVVSETRDSLRRERPRDEQRAGVEPREAAPGRWQGFLRLPSHRPPALDIAVPPSDTAGPAPADDGWADVLELADGDVVLSAGVLAAPRPGAPADTALLVGTLRGMAMADTPPGPLLAALTGLHDAAGRPALAGAVCCRYRPGTRTLEWARTGGPAPLLIRDGTAHRLRAPDEARGTDGLGQAEETLEAGDLLLLHPAGPLASPRLLLPLGRRLAGTRTAQDGVRALAEELGAPGSPGGTGAILLARVLP